MLLVTAVYPHFNVVGWSLVPVQTLSVNDARTTKHNLLLLSEWWHVVWLEADTIRGRNDVQCDKHNRITRDGVFVLVNLQPPFSLNSFGRHFCPSLRSLSSLAVFELVFLLSLSVFLLSAFFRHTFQSSLSLSFFTFSFLSLSFLFKFCLSHFLPAPFFPPVFTLHYCAILTPHIGF